MCARGCSEESLQRVRRKSKPICVWKVLTHKGENLFSRVGLPLCKYGPGTISAKGTSSTTKYNLDAPRGLHVYRHKRTAVEWESVCENDVVVRAYVDPQDVIAVEPYDEPRAQLVACRLTIRPEDWKAAGLPPRATRRRYA